jgi:CheY-like chemotaxis protein
VLLAEDIHDNVLLVREMLESRGHEVAVASDGAEAAERAWTESFDVVLMDIQMPVLDGVGATERIRATEKITGGHVPIIALTASVTESERARCLAAGMDAVVAKPVNFATLFAKMEAAVGPDAGRSLETPGQTSLAWLRPVADVDAVVNDWPDAERYLRSLTSLAAEVPRILDSLTEHIAHAEFGDAAEISHTLGAVATNLGLTDLVEQARRLEHLLERRDPGSMKAIVPLRRAIAGLEALLAAERGGESRPLEVEAAPPPVDPDLLRRLFGDLHVALDTDNPDPAESLVARLAEHLGKEMLEPLRQAIETFDFPRARQQAARMATALGLEQAA